jgi:long-chain acyl-CoA synthetase
MNALDLRPTASPALIDAASAEVLSFRQLVRVATDTAGRIGTERSLVFLLSRNDRFTVTTYAAALIGGHAVALLDGVRPAEVTAELVATYGPGCVAGPAGTGEQLAGLGIPVSAALPVDGGELVRLGYPGPALAPDLQVLLSTSGTTGSRKFVRLSGANIHANAASIASYLALAPSERPITSLPLHYTFGLSVLNSHWLAGAPVVLSSDSVIQQGFWEAFRQHACTSLAGVPYTYLMLERIGFREMELPTLRTLQQAGGALDRRLTQVYADFMARRGGRLFVMYGQTEATARIAYVPPARLAEKLGSAGIAVPGGRLRIDVNGSQPTERPTGEVVYEGPNVMLGYATAPEDLARGDDLGGVLRTGDIGYLDDEGFLFLLGRSKRIAKVFGLRVNLDEVEAMLRERGPAAVVGVEDGIRAFCAFESDEAVTEARDALARRFRVHRDALRFQRVDEIPVTEAGKVDYQQVQRWIAT